MPKVSVLMPVYNSEQTVAESIQSILDQTFTDFEFIIINDGSTDGTVQMINSFNDPRINLISNDQNKDLVYSLNRGLQACTGEYIVRMDADDLAVPDRISKQVEFMEANPQIGVAGTWIKLFGNSDEEYRNPVSHAEIKAMLFFHNVIAHPTVIMRRPALEKFHLEYEKHLAEDYDLWIRASFYFKLANMPEVLLNYRISQGSYSQTNTKKVWGVLNDILISNLAKLQIEIDPTNTPILDILKRVNLKMGVEYASDLSKIVDLWGKIYFQNSRLHIYDPKYFGNYMWILWRYALDTSGLGVKDKILLTLRFMRYTGTAASRGGKYILKLIKTKLRQR